MTAADGRGLSDLVGFVIVFGIILFAASLTLTVGQDQLGQLRENEQIRNAERGMQLLGRQFERIEAGQAAVQTGQLQLGPGSLDVTERTDIVIEVHEESGQNRTYTRSARGIQYRSDDKVIAYEGGGIFRRTDGAQSTGVATVPAKFSCSDSQAFVSVVTLNGRFSIAGGTVAVRSALSDSSVLYPINRTGTDGTRANVQNVTVRFPGLSGSTTGWEFLGESAGWNRTGPNRYTCSGGGNFSAVVRHTDIDVSVSD
jgi:hypothetical protein